MDRTAPIEVVSEKGTEILRVEVGSTAHGCSVEGNDDLDLQGVMIEHREVKLGLNKFDQTTFRTAVARTGQKDCKSEPGDVDITVFSLSRFAQLAYKGNPNIIMSFYSPIVHASDVGLCLVNAAPLFNAKTVGAQFLGYMKAQHERLMGLRGGKGITRPDLVEKYGYDTKYAYHILRLGIQGLQYMQTGKMTVPLPEFFTDFLKQVRLGHYKLETIDGYAKELTADLAAAIDKANMPAHAPVGPINKLLVDLYEWTWA